ncbi:MAG: hypothetical protein JXR46_05600 [Calditrichaceae bacterium]|nr:hypothetical protein [Calditrichaceae bacterium]MBN2708501.1 hypothetical protein [Calditrichaceae bacterium]RQV96022.1 MAG: hypothetical protein EH224_05860 [Calditrichota bacterium]
MTIYLNPYDLYKMCRYFNFDTTDGLFLRNIIRLESAENNTWQPVINFRKKPFVFCPFLINEQDEQGKLKGLCKLHPDYKPLICSLAPVGRAICLDTDNDEFIFVKPAPDCAGIGSDITNDLSEIVKQKYKELSFQKRFFKLLEKCSEKSYKKDDYNRLLYTFSMNKNFPDILTDMEKMIKNRGNSPEKYL